MDKYLVANSSEIHLVFRLAGTQENCVLLELLESMVSSRLMLMH